VTAAEANDGAALASPAVASINPTLVQSERILTSPQGLPGRPWYRHLIYAPGLYTGYGVKTVPAVREAIEQHQWTEADAQIVRVGEVLLAEAALVNRAAQELKAAASSR
jgi:N-acetylated-alpha-linked acidic dipeptidase